MWHDWHDNHGVNDSAKDEENDETQLAPAPPASHANMNMDAARPTTAASSKEALAPENNDGGDEYGDDTFEDGD